MKRLCMKEEKRINFSCLKLWVTGQAATDQTNRVLVNEWKPLKCKTSTKFENLGNKSNSF